MGFEKDALRLRCLYLPVRGPARVAGPEGQLRLRRKALAILYYLALEGATHRERLADLLWDGIDPLSNLRVELNSINRELAGAGLPLFTPYQDPLRLPDGLRLDLQEGPADTLFQGLDGLSADFQEWLDWRRSRLQRSTAGSYGNSALIDSVAVTLQAPCLLIVETEPFGSAAGFVEALSERLRLPILPSAASGSGLRHVSPPYPADLVSRIHDDAHTIWVFEKPFFGPDPTELLELRYRLPSERITYLKLPGLTWFAARSHNPLRKHDFGTAARLYLASCGHNGYLREVAALPYSDEPPVPRKFRAALELELRQLSPDCRHLLDRLVIRRFREGERNLELGRAEECVAELVERNWLEYNGEGWEFTAPLIRRLLFRNIPEGVRQTYQRQRATELLQQGRFVAAQLQLYNAGEEIDLHRLSESVPDWAKQLLEQQTGSDEAEHAVDTQTRNSAPEDAYLELTGTYGSGVEQSGTSVALVRLGQEHSPSGVTLKLPPGRLLLQLTGQSLVHNTMGIGFSPDSAPFSVRLDGSRRVVLVPELRSARRRNELLLPLPQEFEYWFAFTAAHELSIESNADRALIQFDARLYEQKEVGIPRSVYALDA